MRNHSKHNIARGVFIGVLVFLLLVLSLGIGVKFSSPIQDWVDTTFGTEEKEEVDFSELTYVALGDSITYGVDGFTGVHQKMETPYCDVVGETLGFERTVNLGVSGSCISFARGEQNAFCKRYVNIPRDADVISVMGGINDTDENVTIGTISDMSTSTFYGALNVLAKGLKENWSDAFIFFMTPLNARGRVGVYEQVCQAIKDVCAKYEIPVLDTSKLADFSREYNAPGYTGDGLHPSQDFHTTVLAPMIADFIRKNYKPAEAI